jgi:hypothetical protein
VWWNKAVHFMGRTHTFRERERQTDRQTWDPQSSSRS